MNGLINLSSMGTDLFDGCKPEARNLGLPPVLGIALASLCRKRQRMEIRQTHFRLQIREGDFLHLRKSAEQGDLTW